MLKFISISGVLEKNVRNERGKRTEEITRKCNKMRNFYGHKREIKKEDNENSGRLVSS